MTSRSTPSAAPSTGETAAQRAEERRVDGKRLAGRSAVALHKAEQAFLLLCGVGQLFVPVDELDTPHEPSNRSDTLGAAGAAARHRAQSRGVPGQKAARASGKRRLHHVETGPEEEVLPRFVRPRTQPLSGQRFAQLLLPLHPTSRSSRNASSSSHRGHGPSTGITLPLP